MREQKKSGFFTVLMIALLFEPNICVKNNILNIIFIIGAVISFANIVIVKFLKEFKISKISFCFIISRLFLIFSTLINQGDILKVGYQSIVIVSLFLYAEYFYKYEKMNDFIKILKNIFFVYLLINAFLYIIFPDGLYALEKGIHFLGIRTRFTEYSITLILLAILDYRLEKKKINFILEIVVALLNVILPEISTAFVGIGIFLISYMILKRLHNFNYKWLLYAGILLSVLVVFLRIQNMFAFIIEDILHKNISLTGRTEIWDLSYKYIFDKLIVFGHGMPIDGNFVKWGTRLWQSHNQLLQLLYESGIVGTILFYKIIELALKKLNSQNEDLIYKHFLGAMIFSFMIMMITEIYGYYNHFYVILILAYFVNEQKKEKENG